jgi:hypothetical protein
MTDTGPDIINLPHIQKITVRSSGMKWWAALVVTVAALLCLMPPFTSALVRSFRKTSLTDNQKWWISFLIQLVIFFLVIRILLW